MPPIHHPRPRAPDSPLVGCFFGAAFAILGGWGVWSWLAQDALVTAACAWPTAPAMVTRTTVESGMAARLRKSSSSHPIYTPVIAYVFTVDGKAVTGSTLSLTPWNYRYEDEAQAMIGRHPLGSRLSVHFDPARPSDNVLWPENSDRYGMRGVIGGIFILVGLGLIALTFPRTPRKPVLAAR